MIKTLFILWLIMPDGREYHWREFDNIHSCAGTAAAERMAMQRVYQKTKVNLGYKFICRRAI